MLHISSIKATKSGLRTPSIPFKISIALVVRSSTSENSSSGVPSAGPLVEDPSLDLIASLLLCSSWKR